MERRTLILNVVEIEVFLIVPKHQNRLSQQWVCVYYAQPWKERRLLCESMFIPVERRTLILNMAEREVFLIIPRHKNCLSHQRNYVYGAESCKEKGEYYVNLCLSSLKDELQF